MLLYLNDPVYEYEIWTFLKAYYKDEQLQWVKSKEEAEDFAFIVLPESITVEFLDKGKIKAVFSYDKGEISKKCPKTDQIERRKIIKKLVKQLIYDGMKSIENRVQPWGILTGIRPTKVVMTLMEKYNSDWTVISEILRNDYRVSDDKIALMIEVAKQETEIISKNQKDEMSVYIGIPFCPSKCLYCSFTSYSIDKYAKRVPIYLQALEKELEFLKDPSVCNKPIRSVYIGGGTPTSLDAEQLEVLLKIVTKAIDMSGVEEFTVEAGRPDTINYDKLVKLKEYGVTRLSINPQTMNQSTLDVIGRKHTVEDVEKVFNLARELKFDNINMDIILGLPKEMPEDVRKTMERIKHLNPDHVTVHTMAIKRASKLAQEKDSYNLLKGEDIEKMLQIVSSTMQEMDLIPYYLYRQKNMLGNFENVGYARKGKACVYNVEIMEERQTILAFGAGATTKWVSDDCSIIERVENVKQVEYYIERIDEMIARKKIFFDGKYNHTSI